jgi:flagellar biosynthesis/type III secretory pathway protein FliH
LRYKRTFAVTALALAVLGMLAFGAISYAGDQADQRQTLRDRFASDMKAAAAEAEAEQHAAVKAAVAKARTQAAAKLKTTVRKLKARAAKAADHAFEKGRSEGFSSGSAAGYASGNTDGYANGSADGFEDGLTAGSDDLACSDDPDVYWLPACY